MLPACPRTEIADITSELTIVEGRIGRAAGDFASLDEAPPPAMPDWSPARSFGRDGSWGSAKPATLHIEPEHVWLFGVLRRPSTQPRRSLLHQSSCVGSQNFLRISRLRLLGRINWVSATEDRHMDLKLKGRRPLVTGSTAGIGRAITTSLAREGARLLLPAAHGPAWSSRI
jgi:hypothetical protein